MPNIIGHFIYYPNEAIVYPSVSMMLKLSRVYIEAFPTFYDVTKEVTVAIRWWSVIYLLWEVLFRMCSHQTWSRWSPREKNTSVVPMYARHAHHAHTHTRHKQSASEGVRKSVSRTRLLVPKLSIMLHYNLVVSQSRPIITHINVIWCVQHRTIYVTI